MDMNQNIGNIMKEAQKMQESMVAAQDEISKIIVIGEAGGGVVKVHMNGSNDAIKIDIHPSMMEEEASMLGDLVAAAINDANRKIKKVTQERISKLTAGFNLPADFMKDGKE